MQLKAYRHKEYKDVYIRRNSNNPSKIGVQCYDSCDVADSIKSVSLLGDKFSDAKLTPIVFAVKKDVEEDGYKGTLKKVIKCTFDDFEEVTFREI